MTIFVTSLVIMTTFKTLMWLLIGQFLLRWQLTVVEYKLHTVQLFV